MMCPDVVIYSDDNDLVSSVALCFCYENVTIFIIFHNFSFFLKSDYKFRNDEIFKRLKVTTFAQLVSTDQYISVLSLWGFNSPSVAFVVIIKLRVNLLHLQPLRKEKCMNNFATTSARLSSMFLDC